MTTTKTMTKILKERWQKLAGILDESSYHRAKHDHIVRTINKHIGSIEKMVLEIDPNLFDDDIYEVVGDISAMLKNYFKNLLKEGTSPEASQDLAAYFGSNDSVDGPYKKVSKVQPFDDDKHKKEFLKKIKAENLKEGQYPETASEYAEMLNQQSEGPFKLVTDPAHWDEYGVKTGEELAKYLAIEAHRNAYKEAYGIRPRHVNYDKLSIEEIEKRVDDLYRSMEQEDDLDDFDYRDFGEEEYEQRQTEFHKDDDERDEWDKEYDKYEKYELEFD